MGIFDVNLPKNEELEKYDNMTEEELQNEIKFRIDTLVCDNKFKSRRIKELENEVVELKSKNSYMRQHLKEFRGHSKSMFNPTIRECIIYLHDEGLIGEIDFSDLINELDELYESQA